MIKMMATGGELLADDSWRSATCCLVDNGVEMVKECTYKLPFDWHFYYHHAVDDHSNLGHSLPNIEDSWLTKYYKCLVIEFILAIIEVNTFLSIYYVKGKKEMSTWFAFLGNLPDR